MFKLIVILNQHLSINSYIMKKTILILLTIIFAITLNAKAHDFSAINNGDTIYYNITSTTAPFSVAVTFKGDYNDSFINEYSGSVSIPDSVQYNGNYYKVTSIGKYTFRKCATLTSLIIPYSVTSFEYSSFSECSNLASLIIPNSVTSIGSSAFYACSSLSSMIIPNSVTSIGYGIFSSCTGLISVTISSSINSIGSWFFNGCSALTSITCNAAIPPTAESNSFYGVNKNIPVYVPCNSISSYQSALHWSEFTNYVGIRIPQYINASICEGDIYTNYGANIDSAGVYNIVSGCDSIILNLILNPTYQTNHYDTICKGQTYNNYGFNFIADTIGLYTQNHNTINGCDSIIKLYLIVNSTPNPPSNLTINQISNFFEITWQSNGISYEIYRDDSLIANVTQPIYLDYDLIHEQPYCYKVKSINGDCESELSNINCKTYLNIENIEQPYISTKLYPNPTNNKAKLEIEGLNSDAEVLVYDMIGRVIQKHTINKGNNELEIDLSGNAKGVYSIRIINDNINQTKKLIVQ